MFLHVILLFVLAAAAAFVGVARTILTLCRQARTAWNVHMEYVYTPWVYRFFAVVWFIVVIGDAVFILSIWR